MPKTNKTPASVLTGLMNEYNLNPYSLSKEINLSASAVRLLVIGKSNITVSTALRLSKYFGQSPSYWMDLQRDADLAEAAGDKKLAAVLKGISKAKKGAAKPKAKAAGKGKAKKKVTLKDKRPKAAKAGAKKAKAGAKKKTVKAKAAKPAAKKAVRKPRAKKV